MFTRNFPHQQDRGISLIPRDSVFSYKGIEEDLEDQTIGSTVSLNGGTVVVRFENYGNYDCGTMGVK